MTDDPTVGWEEAELSRRKLLQYGAGLVVAGALAGTLERTANAAVVKRGGTIKVGISDYLAGDSLDPVLTISTLGLMSSGMLYDTLVHIDPQWRVTPMLATSWDVNKTATRYTFKLRRGVEFHSGKTLEAADVAATIKRVLDPKVGSTGLSLFGPVLKPSGIKVLDKQTIQFNLSSPDVFFLIKMGFWYGRVHQAGWNFKNGSGGTGPFKSRTFTPSQGFQYVRNPNYWQSGLPYLDGITGIVVTEPSTKAQALLNGDMDMIDPPSFPAVPQFARAKDRVSVLKGPFGYQFDFGIALDRKVAGKTPYADPNVRRALKMMIDRKQWVKTVCYGQAVVGADVPMNPYDPYFPRDLKATYDPERGKALLKKAGYGDGWTEQAFTSPTFKGMNDSCVFLKQEWAPAKVNLNVQSTPVPAWEKHFLKADGVLGNYWARQHPSTMLPFMASSTGAWNEAHIKDPKIDKLLKEVQSAKSFSKQKEIFREILHRYEAGSPTIWVGFFSDYWPYQKRLRGVKLAPTDLVDFRRAQLT